MNAISFSHAVPALSKATQFLEAPIGASVADMAAMVSAAGFDGHGRTWDGPLYAYVKTGEVGGVPVYGEKPLPQEWWRHVHPKQDGVVLFCGRPAGGGSGSQVLALVAAVALTAVAGPLGTAFATSIAGFGAAVAGSAGFLALQAGITAGIAIGGSLLLNKLFAAEPGAAAASVAAGAVQAFEDVTADANLLGRDAFPPHVFGQRRISPPDLVHPRFYLDNGQQAVERLLGAYGRHAISDVKVNGNLVADMDGVTVETRDGAPGTTTITSVTRYSSPVQIGEQLTNFSVTDVTLEDQVTPANSSPDWIYFTTPDLGPNMDEIAIRLRIDQFVKGDGSSTNILVPIRLQCRALGDSTWISFPEMHFTGYDGRTLIKDIRLRWDTAFGGFDPSSSVDIAFWREVPATANTLADGSSGTQWTANSHFDADTGYQDVANCKASKSGPRITLNTTTWPKATSYEWRIKRGVAVDASSLNGNYQLSGTVRSLFVAYDSSGTWITPINVAARPAQFSAQIATTIVEDHPVQMPHMALIALQSVGQSVRNVSAVFSGYAKTGASLDTWAETSNPAYQTRQLLEDLVSYSKVADSSKYSSIAALAQSLLVNTDWTGWAAQCTVMGATCSLVTAGDERVGEVLQRLLASGLARPAIGPKLRIDYFRDRSAEDPVITFSPRNASIQMAYEAPQRPMGLRATFRDKNRDWEESELEVRNPISGSTGNWLKQDIKAIDDPAWLRARLTFDMLRAYYWRTRYHVSNMLEGMACRPGTLVGLITDLVNDRAHGARVLSTEDGQTLLVDQIVPAESTLPDLDAAWSFGDLFETGEQSYVEMTTPTGLEWRTVIDFTESSGGRSGALVVDSPFTSASPSTDFPGNHLAIGSLSSKVRRCIVVEDQPGDEFQSNLILADEAPEIYATMKDMFGWES